VPVSPSGSTVARSPANKTLKVDDNWATVYRKPTTTTCSVSKLDQEVYKLLVSVSDNDVQMVKFHLGWLNLETEYPEVADIDVTKMSVCHPLCGCEKCFLVLKVC